MSGKALSVAMPTVSFKLHDAFNLYRISNVPPHLCYHMVNYALAPAASAADLYLEQQAAAGKNEKAIV